MRTAHIAIGLVSLAAGPVSDVRIVIAEEDLDPCPLLEFDGGVCTDTFDMVVVATGAYRVPQVRVCAWLLFRARVSVTCKPCIASGMFIPL